MTIVGALHFAAPVTAFAETSTSAPSPSLSVQQSGHPFAEYIAAASQRFGIPENWIAAVLRAESAGDPRAVSSAGARGLMQVMPDTWAELRARYGLGHDPYDPRDNIMAGTAYLREMWERYGNVSAMLAAYNAGPGRYDEYLSSGRSLPAETRAYVAALAPILGGAAVLETPIRAQTSPQDWRDAPLFIAPSGSSHAAAARQTGDETGGLFVTVSDRARP